MSQDRFRRLARRAPQKRLVALAAGVSLSALVPQARATDCTWATGEYPGGAVPTPPRRAHCWPPTRWTSFPAAPSASSAARSRTSATSAMFEVARIEPAADVIPLPTQARKAQRLRLPKAV